MAESTEITALQQAWRESHPGEAVVAPPTRALSELENWHFDTQGFLCLRGVATPAELQAAPADLASHPVLRRYAEDLCGIGYRLDTPVRDVAELDPGRLVGGDARTRDPAREYFHTAAGYILTEDSQQNPPNGYNEHVHVRQCQGLLAIWALRDVEAGTGFALVPCSHLADVEPPRCLNQGQDLDGPLSVISQPTMHGEPRRTSVCCFSFTPCSVCAVSDLAVVSVGMQPEICCWWPKRRCTASSALAHQTLAAR